MSVTTASTVINNDIYTLTAQEEIDCYGEDNVQREKYNYKDPNHKPPFVGEDYTEIPANENDEMNTWQLVQKVSIFVQLQNDLILLVFGIIKIQKKLKSGDHRESLIM